VTNKLPFNFSDLINAFKNAGFPTKKDVEDIVHKQITEFHANMIIPEFDKVNKKLDIHSNQIQGLTSKVKELKNAAAETKRDIHYIKDDIKNIEFEMGITPKRKVLASS
jgi:uncharacterized coiled-coil DUF342 family protein